jgi:hypothetical protein
MRTKPRPRPAFKPGRDDWSKFHGFVFFYSDRWLKQFHFSRCLLYSECERMLEIVKAGQAVRKFAQRLVDRNFRPRSFSFDGVPKGPIAIAMSGGVDSSVAALLLKNEGHEVFAIHMQNWDEEEEHGDHRGPGVCSSAQDILDVKRTCRLLDIPLYEVGAHSARRRRYVSFPHRA